MFQRKKKQLRPPRMFLIYLTLIQWISIVFKFIDKAGTAIQPGQRSEGIGAENRSWKFIFKNKTSIDLTSA